ncbi:MAG: hypothetical protein WD176_08660, partial [Pirellulales bacterium]
MVGGTADFQAGYVQTDFTLPAGPRMVYSTAGDARPIIIVETPQPADGAVPDKIKAELTFAGNTGAPVYYSTSGLVAGQTLRFALQADATALPSGTHDWTLHLTEYHGAETATRTFTGTKIIVNRADSPFGKQWWIDGLDQLVVDAAGADVVFSDGTTARFTGTDGTYSAPSWLQSTLTRSGSAGDYSYSYQSKYGDTAVFNHQGQLTQRVDTNGNLLSYAYASGLLSTIRDSLGRTSTLTYTNGRLQSITDFAGRTTSFTVDATSRELRTIVEPAVTVAGVSVQPTTNYVYSAASGLLESIEDPRENLTAFEYDHARRLKSRTLADGSVTEFSLVMVQGLANLSANAGTLANPLPFSTPAAAVGTVVEHVTAVERRTTRYKTDQFGNPTEIIDTAGNVFTYLRNADGQVEEMVEPDPDAAGPLSPLTTTYVYNTSTKNLESMTLSDGTSTRGWTYGPFNQVASYTDERGLLTEYDIDPATGGIRSVIHRNPADPAGDIVTGYTYTPPPQAAGDLPGGLVVTVTDPRGNVTRYTYYNVASELHRFGRVKTITSADGTPDAGEEEFDYDLKGNLAAHTDARDHTTNYEYDALNRLTRIKQPDPSGNLVELQRPVTLYEYDAVGNLLKSTDAEGNVSRFVYDGLNRVKEAYSPHKNGPTAGDGLKTAYSYLLDGRLDKVTETTTSQTVRLTDYDYDALGYLSKTTLPATAAGTPVYVYQHGPLGDLLSTTDAENNTTDYSYDNRRRVTGVELPDPDTTLPGTLPRPVIAYTYDAGGNVDTMTDSVFTTDYDYDFLGRLEQTTLPDPDGAGSHTAVITR